MCPSIQILQKLQFRTQDSGRPRSQTSPVQNSQSGVQTFRLVFRPPLSRPIRTSHTDLQLHHPAAVPTSGDLNQHQQTYTNAPPRSVCGQQELRPQRGSPGLPSVPGQRLLVPVPALQEPGLLPGGRCIGRLMNQHFWGLVKAD